MALELLRIATVVAAVSLMPRTPTLRDDVQVIELNHVYNADGQHLFSQLIFWDKQTGPRSEHVVAWRLWKPSQPQPLRDVRQGGCRLLFRDGAHLRLVRGQHFRQTWTQYDPEIEDRRYLSQYRRRELGNIKPPAAAQTRTSWQR